MTLPKYPLYKDSGVEWLGEVPAGWEVKPLKHNFYLLTEKTERREYPIALENIQSWSGRFVRTETEFEGEGVAFKPGDILFGKLRPYLAKAYLADVSGEAVGDFHVMRPGRLMDGKFSVYQILTREFIAIADSSTYGAKMPRVSWDFMASMPFATPPLPEQSAIAAFLDRETARIDTLVGQYRRLIDLLAEKRQGVISHAVTKGIDPSAKMKDSGVEWLGEVPEGWGVKRLKRNFTLLTEKTDRRENPVALENIQSWSSRFIPTETEFEGEGVAFEPGDLLFGKLRPYLAKAYLTDVSGEAVGDFHVMRPMRFMDGRYSIYQILTREFIDIVDGSTYGAKMPRVSWDFMANMPFATPPLAEQAAIAAHLDRETAKLDALTAEAERAIGLLQEHRSALISAAVTGKVDVRGVNL